MQSAFPDPSAGELPMDRPLWFRLHTHGLED
jgi:hypothetical protein